MFCRLEIRDYPVFLALGWYPEERKCPQELLVSLTIGYHYQRPASEILTSVVDYDAVIKQVDKYSQSWQFDSGVRLLETYGGGLVEDLLSSFPQIEDLEVTLQKKVFQDGFGKGASIKVRLTSS